jgi:hypothetical protein
MKQKRTKYDTLNNPEGYAKLQAFKDFAKWLMREFLGSKWEFGWMRDRCQIRTLAKCTHSHNGSFRLDGGGWLLFSRIIVERSPEQQRDTIMHEISHALNEVSRRSKN